MVPCVRPRPFRSGCEAGACCDMHGNGLRDAEAGGIGDDYGRPITQVPEGLHQPLDLLHQHAPGRFVGNPPVTQTSGRHRASRYGKPREEIALILVRIKSRTSSAPNWAGDFSSVVQEMADLEQTVLAGVLGQIDHDHLAGYWKPCLPIDFIPVNNDRFVDALAAAVNVAGSGPGR